MLQAMKELIEEKAKYCQAYSDKANALMIEHVVDTLDCLNNKGEGTFEFNSGNGTWFYLFNDEIIHDNELEENYLGEFLFSDESLGIIRDSVEYLGDISCKLDVTPDYNSSILSHQSMIVQLASVLRKLDKYTQKDFEHMVEQLPDYCNDEVVEKLFRKHLKLGG